MLNIANLALGYDAPNILTGVNLSVKAGEIVALVGQNGVGKSSLLYAIMGLMPHVSGAATFHQIDLTRKKPYEIARLGISLVRQENAVFADLTVREHFQLVNQLSLDENLRYFPDLLPKYKQRAKRLSGGQKQQLAIALALSNHPKLLLLDEPSANIQPSIVESMIETLKQVNQESGLTIILTEQNLSVIGRLSQTAYLIKAGQLFESGINTLNLTRASLAEQLSALESKVSHV